MSSKDGTVGRRGGMVLYPDGRPLGKDGFIISLILGVHVKASQCVAG